MPALPRLLVPLAVAALPATPTAATAPPDPAAIPEARVRVVVPDFGEFVIALDREDAPNHVAAFLALTALGAFDGVSFHRVLPRYLVQTGDRGTVDDDPANDGVIPEWALPDEPVSRSHRRGTVSMAWQEDRPGTAGTQWLVALEDLPTLDGRATPIGEVVEGMDVVDAISQVSTWRDGNPLKPVRIESARVEAPPAGGGPPARPAGGDEAG